MYPLKNKVLTKSLIIILMMGAIVLTHPTVAQKSDHLVDEDDLEINGLLIDETVTKLGRDFYELFFKNWVPPNIEMSYTLYIKEHLQPGRVTKISVLLNDNVLMSQMLQPRREVLLALSQRAIKIVHYRLVNYRSMIKTLESEDQIGNGVY